MDDMTNPGVSNGASPEPQDTAEFARAMRAQLATVTGGLAPDVYVNAWWDWYLNLSKEPPKQLQVMQDALAKSFDTWDFALRAARGEVLPPAEGDSRFAGESWAQWPFNIYARTYSNYVDWLQKAYSQVPGVAPEHERSLNFAAKQRDRSPVTGELFGDESGAARSDARRGRSKSGARIQELARGR
jgi:polyhydroxyalkanoate synthase subunit PhaC